MKVTKKQLLGRIRQLEAAIKKVGELQAMTHKRYDAERDVYVKALKDAIEIIDDELGGRKCAWTRDDSRRLESIRFLSLGV